MRLALISDSHYPWKLTKLSVLASHYGYTESFYSNLELFYSQISTFEVDALIINGDFGWDLFSFPFSENILEKMDPMWYFYPFVQVSIVRNLVDERIPLIFTKGNHDFWFELVVNPINDNGTKELYLDIRKFEHYLQQFALSRTKNTQIFQTIVDYFGDSPVGMDSKIKLGENIILLHNSGMCLRDVLLYGLPWYEKNDSIKSWTMYKQEIVHDYISFVQYAQNKMNPNKIIILQHRNPPTMNFIKEFNTTHLHYFCYGHWHGISDFMVEKYMKYGHYVCVMPEKNQFKPVILEV
ncbi:MAG: metallophosphoesterase [Candidatus Lokiarchaeota archaeon]|nr:metallophosphoesterase [Candidatus Lokiarchaeota archaeon]